jgi:small subunit ribosomal protein S2
MEEIRLFGGYKERKFFMPKIPSLLEMLKAGMHFGHRPSRRYPKMEPYLYTERDNVDIINLEKSQEKLIQALEFVKKITEQSGTILFVGSKRQAKSIIKNYADQVGAPYIVERWVGGCFTNFGNIYKLINKLKDLEAKKLQGDLKKYTKKEQLEFEKQITRLNLLVGGIKNLSKIPEAVFIVDIKKEKTAMKEAIKTKVPIIAMVDSNVNPEGVTYPIPCNDDATKAIEMITGLVAETIKEGRKQ